MQEDNCLKLFIDPSSVTAFSYTMLLTALYPLQGTLCVRQEYILEPFGNPCGHMENTQIFPQAVIQAQDQVLKWIYKNKMTF